MKHVSVASDLRVTWIQKLVAGAVENSRKIQCGSEV